MNIWSIIIAAAIFILPSLLPSKKNARKKAEHPAPAPKMEDVFESIFNIGDADGDADGEEVFSPADMADVAAEDDLGQPIFSYETANFDRTDISDSVADRVESMRSDESDSMSVTALDETFDLRKAIIYQTIMQRVSA